MSIGVKINGVSRAKSRVKALTKISQKQIAEGVNRAAAIVEGGAKADCPVDTGLLRGSIHITPANVKGSSISAQVGTNVEYAPYVEFGTGIRGGHYKYPTKMKLHFSKDVAGQMAQPFLGKSLNDNKDTVAAIIRGALNGAIQDV